MGANKIKTVKIASPYTVEKQEHQVPRFLIIMGMVLLVVIVVYVVVLLLTKQNDEITNTIVNEGSVINEFA